MKAVVYERRSRPDVLVLREVDKPVPAENEVLVKVHAAAPNAADYRSMQLGIIPKTKIFGADFAGTGEQVGASVTKFRPGDEVFGESDVPKFGAFAEYIAVQERFLVPKPAQVSFEAAAAIPMAAETALQALRDDGQIQPGHKVLIVGAGGGVGTYAVQLARHLGAQVTAVCGPNNVEQTRSLGADEVIDYSKAGFSKTGKQFDLILAVNGSHALSTYSRLLVSNGRCVMVGGGYKQIARFLLFGKIKSLGGKKFSLCSAKLRAADYEYVARLVAEGKVRSVIDRTYPLERTAEAMTYLKAGHARGKVVIQVA